MYSFTESDAALVPVTTAPADGAGGDAPVAAPKAANGAAGPLVSAAAAAVLLLAAVL
jgi:hypothetical protein